MFSHHEPIRHYHGDTVRSLFLAVVSVYFLAIPFWGHILPFGTLFEVLSGIVLIALAGFINPHSRWVMVLCAIAAAFGAFLLEVTAITYHARDPLPLLLVREVGALMLLAALYYSVRTLRAMSQGKIGMAPLPWEFEKKRANDTDV